MRTPLCLRGAAARASLLASLALLGACGSSSDSAPQPTSAIPATPQGAAMATVSGDTAGVGTTFFNSAGKGFVALSSDGDAPISILHVADGTRGRRAPVANAFVTLSYARVAPLTLVALTGTALAGSYQMLAGGKPASIAVAADGAISAGASDCKLSGKIDFANGFGGAQAVSITVSNCGTLSNGSYNGLVFASADTAPASWQLLAENGSSVIDVLAYR